MFVTIVTWLLSRWLLYISRKLGKTFEPVNFINPKKANIFFSRRFCGDSECLQRSWILFDRCSKENFEKIACVQSYPSIWFCKYFLFHDPFSNWWNGILVALYLSPIWNFLKFTNSWWIERYPPKTAKIVQKVLLWTNAYFYIAIYI